MHEYDVTLKSILTRASGSLLRQLIGFEVSRWHNVELPVVRHRRADLLGETATGRLVHFELQSTNQKQMALRMLEYSTAIRRHFRQFPEQVVLYVGNPPLRMDGGLEGPGLRYQCRFFDIRDLDASTLLASRNLEDNVLAVLGRLGDELPAVRRILARIAGSGRDERTAALGELMVLSGLRNLEPIIESEVERMPILNDIMDHKVIGRERKRGIAMGLEEGRSEGIVQGKRQVLLTLIARRFGTVPEWAEESVGNFSAEELDTAITRIFDAATIEQLLG
jgi:predicted transposase YdaD